MRVRPPLAVLAAALAAAPAPHVRPAAAQAVAQGAPASRLPERLADAEFWRLVTDLSEPGGFFRSENFVGNETTLQLVLPQLERSVRQGGVYVGVGPDQNFTYLVALRPRVAFVVDIRRQNLQQHLMYKALLELSPDRAAFLSHLFARPRPASLAAGASLEAMFAAYRAAAPDSALARRTRAAMREQLVARHAFPMTEEDLRAIEYVHGAFVAAGPDINYSYVPGSTPAPMWGRMPTYDQMLLADDGAGERRSYLSTEERYRTLRMLETENRIVPVVGDFAGPRALRAIGDWLRARGATVDAFYTSNVEQYLFRQGDDWKRFFANVGAMPTDSASTFVRAVFNGMGGWRMQSPATPVNPTDSLRPSYPMIPFARATMMLSPIRETVQAVEAGRVQSYFDVIQLSK